MLIQEELNNAINAQIGSELFASNQYVALAVYFDQEALPVLAKHFYDQAVEEREHALKFIKYIVDTGGSLQIPAVPAPKADFASAAEAVELALTQEIKVTEQINHLMTLARLAHDYLGEQFLTWFINEQLEEVSSAEALLRTIKRVGESGLLQVEDYLSRNALPTEA